MCSPCALRALEGKREIGEQETDRLKLLWKKLVVGAAAIRLGSKWTEVLVGVSVVIIFGGYWLRHRFVIPASECDEAS